MKSLCQHPVWVESQGFYADCGHCMSCRLNLMRNWVLRITHELPYHNHLLMRVDLTYDPEHLPADRGLSKRDLQLFLKRFRKQSGLKFKYFAAGEYGPKTFRPHYHLILLGVPISYAKMIFDCWGKCSAFGYKCKMILDWHSPKAINYVVGYTVKKIGVYYGEKFRTQHHKEPPFQLQSKGIGYAYAISDHYMWCTGYLRHNGKDVVPPRYYRKKLALTYHFYKDRIAQKMEDTYEQVSKMALESSFFVGYSDVRHRLVYAGRVVTDTFFRYLQILRNEVNHRLTAQTRDWRAGIA